MRRINALLIVLTILLISILSGCYTDSNENITDKIETSKAESYNRQWYDRIISAINQYEYDIQESVTQTDTITEYRVIYDYSFIGTYYYSFIVYDDGTDEPIILVY